MKLAYILSAFALTLSLNACNEQAKEGNTIVVEKKKGTSIEINPNGGSYKTNDVSIKVKD